MDSARIRGYSRNLKMLRQQGERCGDNGRGTSLASGAELPFTSTSVAPLRKIEIPNEVRLAKAQGGVLEEWCEYVGGSIPV
jgi:hypothetical protein